MIGVDTNVLVRYVVRDDEAQFAAAAELLESLNRQQPGFITQVVLVELYWVLSRGYRYPTATCLDLIGALISTDSLEFEDGEGVVRALTLAEEGADFSDALIHGSMELFGVTETVTFDRRAAHHLGWRLL